MEKVADLKLLVDMIDKAITEQSEKFRLEAVTKLSEGRFQATFAKL